MSQRSTATPYNQQELREVGQLFSPVAAKFIQTDLEAAVREAEQIRGNEYVRDSAMVAASAVRIVMASPQQSKEESRRLYSRAYGNTESIAEKLRSSDEPAMQVLATRAALGSVYAQIGLAELEDTSSVSSVDPQKALQIAHEAASSIDRSAGAIAQGMRGLVDVAAALAEARVNGNQAQARKLIQAVGSRMASLPIFNQLLADATIEIQQGPEYFRQAPADIKGDRNLAFLRIFLPNSDLYLLDWAAAQPSSRV